MHTYLIYVYVHTYICIKMYMVYTIYIIYIYTYSIYIKAPTCKIIIYNGTNLGTRYLYVFNNSI